MKYIIPTIEVLRNAYLPFIKNGGLFIPTRETYQLGAILSLSLTLPEDLIECIVPCTVVWLTPLGAQNDQPAGIGVQFDNTEQNQKLFYRIQAILGRD